MCKEFDWVRSSVTLGQLGLDSLDYHVFWFERTRDVEGRATRFVHATSNPYGPEDLLYATGETRELAVLVCLVS